MAWQFRGNLHLVWGEGCDLFFVVVAVRRWVLQNTVLLRRLVYDLTSVLVCYKHIFSLSFSLTCGVMNNVSTRVVAYNSVV